VIIDEDDGDPDIDSILRVDDSDGILVIIDEDDGEPD